MAPHTTHRNASEETSAPPPPSKKQFVKKKVDSRVRTLVENGVQLGHRSFFVIVGDRGKDQVMYLHYMLSKARVAQKPSVLWCYKKELGFSSHRKKRMKQHQAMVKRGLRDHDTEDPFELFIAGTNIRYCYYKESEKILGSTYGMCVLQDFEALTPNLLARTIETVEGGGIVVLLLRTMKSLRQLYSMSMDVHARYRTDSHDDVVGRFNERFILSLGDHGNCLVVDDELNILPISKGRSVKPLPPPASAEDAQSPKEKELSELKESLKDTQPVSALIQQAKTLDQAKAILTFIEAISEKTLQSTVTLTAARGRGKSAAMGIALASAVAYGYSNIFVTSPSPENLQTLFAFIFKTFDALGYEEHLDYDIVQSTNPDFHKAIVRVNIFRQHRQTIQYIQPQDAHVLGQAELVAIDEAAAIPLPLVRKLMGPYLVFMASTINGYEGTGRSLSLKLIQQLREQSSGLSVAAAKAAAASTNGAEGKAVGGRTLREIKLDEPIRYAENDATEQWLNKLLCLDATLVQRAPVGCPHPSDCELYAVNRDTLFSYHPLSEVFLQRMMSLYVASHYKNTPNDLQLMSDAPAHQLFVLLPPVREEDTALPEPLAVIQVCLEGEISRASVLASLSRGKRADGDLIPWTVAQQYQDDDFASLSGARVVRIATHPDYTRMGYGSRALELLIQFYEGKVPSLMEEEEESVDEVANADKDMENGAEVDGLLSEVLRVRDPSKMPPLLSSLSETKPPNLHWIGVSYGLTADLLRFWKRAQFAPVYLRQTPNDLTGEHSCIMMRPVQNAVVQCDPTWLASFAGDFKRRFLQLCSFQFGKFTPAVALNMMDIKLVNGKIEEKPITYGELMQQFSAYDLKRLESYSNNMLDYHVIMDMLPTLAQLYFLGRMQSSSIPTVKEGKGEEGNGDDQEESLLEVLEGDKPKHTRVQLSAVQQAILLGMGLQRKSMDQLSTDLNIPVSQLLALFIRAMRKMSEFCKQLCTDAVQQEIKTPSVTATASTKSSVSPSGIRALNDEEAWDPTEQTLQDDMEEAESEAKEALRKRQQELIESLDLSQYAIAGTNQEWTSALSSDKIVSKKSGLLSVKSGEEKKGKRKSQVSLEDVEEEARKWSEKNTPGAGGKSKQKKKQKSSSVGGKRK